MVLALSEFGFGVIWGLIMMVPLCELGGKEIGP